MKYVVAHTGARRGYAVPSILQKAGLLERFYTDICADVGLGKLLCAAGKLGFKHPELRRLSTRRLPPNLIAKTNTFSWPNLKMYLSGARQGEAEAVFRANVRWQCELGKRMARAGFGEA